MTIPVASDIFGNLRPGSTEKVIGISFSAGREVHGATMVVLYYQQGLRSAWGQIRKGQLVNADPRDQVNPFPTMIIGLRGRAKATVGGV